MHGLQVRQDNQSAILKIWWAQKQRISKKNKASRKNVLIWVHTLQQRRKENEPKWSIRTDKNTYRKQKTNKW